MEFFVVVALISFALLIAEVLLSTGGVLAALGALGLIAGGILALGSDSSDADVLGPALIALGVASGVAFYFITRKVIAAQRSKPASGGSELIGTSAEVRTPLAPEGQVWVEGALWRARLDGPGPARPGDRVTVEAVEGLTLVVRPPQPARHLEEGAT
ncbi:MAG TPA: NfeD family protein [Solirubrobacterales bacterium]|nr:NfeD family protein [Solirubrobacterales bacterium]